MGLGRVNVRPGMGEIFVGITEYILLVGITEYILLVTNHEHRHFIIGMRQKLKNCNHVKPKNALHSIEIRKPKTAF